MRCSLDRRRPRPGPHGTSKIRSVEGTGSGAGGGSTVESAPSDPGSTAHSQAAVDSSSAARPWEATYRAVR